MSNPPKKGPAILMLKQDLKLETALLGDTTSVHHLQTEDYISIQFALSPPADKHLEFNDLS
jgi:hypothetical protein